LLGIRKKATDIAIDYLPIIKRYKYNS
jgi:hypothetical protein